MNDRDPLLNNEPLSGISHPFYKYSWRNQCPNNDCFIFLFTKSTARTVCLIVTTIVLLLFIALFLTLFFLSPRSPDLTVGIVSNYKWQNMVTPYSLSFLVGTEIVNNNYVELDVKMVELAAYYGSWNLGVWIEKDSIPLQDTWSTKFNVDLNPIPQELYDGMIADCNKNGFYEIHFDGFVGTEYFVFEDWWRTIFTRQFSCNQTQVIKP